MNNASLEITTRIGCSINCKFCPQKLLIDNYTSVKRDIMMSFETFKRCIDKLPASVEIHFTGMSEPWGNPECTKMVEYAALGGIRYMFLQHL